MSRYNINVLKNLKFIFHKLKNSINKNISYLYYKQF